MGAQFAFAARTRLVRSLRRIERQSTADRSANALAAGSVFFSRPTFGHFARSHAEIAERATEIFEAILDGSLQIRVSNTYKLTDAAKPTAT